MPCAIHPATFYKSDWRKVWGELITKHYIREEWIERQSVNCSNSMRDERQSWRKFKLELKTGQRWWTANTDWLYLVPHSTCPPCGWLPHFHKSLGLYLTRGRKKNTCCCFKRTESMKKIASCSYPADTLCGYTWHIHSRINVLFHKTCTWPRAVNHCVTALRSKANYLCISKKEMRSQSAESMLATNEGST